MIHPQDSIQSLPPLELEAEGKHNASGKVDNEWDYNPHEIPKEKKGKPDDT